MYYHLKNKLGSCLKALCATAILAGFSSQAIAFGSYKPFGQRTITDTVAASGGEFDFNGQDFDLLLNAVKAAGLAEALAAEDADLTVLAPNDRAFIQLARDLGYRGYREEGAFNTIVETLSILGGGDPIRLLTDVLLYHVSPGAKSFSQIPRTEVIDTLLAAGQIYSIGNLLIDSDPDFNNPVFRGRVNIRTSNGIIHTINRVLIPADLPNSDPNAGTITDIVAASGGDFDRRFFDFDILLNAVKAAGLAEALADPEAALTVFAPTDLAFIRLARSLGYRGFREQGAFDFIVTALTGLGDGDPIPVLTNILLYHVSPGTQTLKDVLLSDSITTLLPDATFAPDGINLKDAAPGLRDPHLRISASDIRASNGLIHSINRVLIPLDL